MDTLFSISLFGYSIPIDPWTLFGLVGNVVFTTRIIIQWIASEGAGRTVVPVAFWWFSFLGALVMIIYAYGRAEIPFILGFAVTLVPYTRNLMLHYRPERPPLKLGIVLATAVALGCIPVVIFWESEAVRDSWLYVGLLGNLIFSTRFFLQWVQSEAERRSVLSLSFWVVSLVGSVILLAYSIVRQDLPFTLGFVFNIIPYTRNIVFHLRERRAAAA